MLLFKNRRLACLQKVYEENRSRLCAAAAALPGVDAQLAEDAVQEAWLRLTRPEILEKIDIDPDRLQGLMLVTVCNAARNMRRAAATTTLPGEDTFAELPEPTLDIAELSERKAVATALRKMVNALPEPDRSILLLQYGRGCTGAEVATLLNLSEATVRQRSHRARERLKKTLEKEGYGNHE